MKVSLILTVYNEESNIAEFVSSVNNQSRRPDELIIVDGGSSDNTVRKFKQCIHESINVKVIIDKRLNKAQSSGPIAAGRNTAIEHVTNEVVLVTDAGCVLSENWVQELVLRFDSGADVVCGNYLGKHGNKLQNRLAEIFCPPDREFSKENFLPSSRSLGFKKNLWQAVGGYPTNSYTAEDTMFARCLYKEATNVKFAPSAIVYWELPGSYKELWVKVFNYGVGDAIQNLDALKYLARLIIVTFPMIYLLLVVFYKKRWIGYVIYLAQVSGYISGKLRLLS